MIRYAYRPEKGLTMERLKRSKDRKVANSLTAKGGVRIANSFGLPAGREYSCPAATSVCSKICYAGKLEKVYKGVKENLLHNWNYLKDASLDRQIELLDESITAFEAECDKWEANKDFRIHWDGDFFSGQYTMAWAEVIKRHPSVTFWVYTRVEAAAYQLKDLENLTLYFSTDSENFEAAERVARAGIKLAGLHDTFRQVKDMLVTIGERAAVCPEQRGQIDLVGACTSCRICLKGQTNIAFSISKK